MKTLKYLFTVALAMVLSAPLMAQEAAYNEMLKPIEKALKANDAASLKNLVKEYNKNFKKSPEALVALGNTYLLNKHFDEAAEVANQVITKYKNCGAAYCLLGDIEAMKDQGGNAAMWYNQAMTMDPQNPEGYMRYANVYRKRSPEEAAKALKQLKQVRPDFPIEADAAHTFYAGGQYDKAFEYFKQTNKSNLEDWRLAEYALTAYMVDKKPEALELAEYGISKFPKNISFKRIALWSAVDTQKFSEALGHAEAVMGDTAKKSARDFNYYGMALKGNNLYEKAIEQYNKALSLDSKDFKPLQYISEVYTAMGLEDKALEYSERYMNNSPAASASDYIKLAGIYIQKAGKGDAPEANFAKALGIYENMGKKFPSIGYFARLQAANSAFQTERDDIALDYYKKVINELEAKQCDNDELGALKTAYKNAGYIYWSTKNDLNAAYPYFQKLLKLDPENSLAKQAVEAKEELDNMGTEQPAE